MNKRSFMAGILCLSAAPAIVKASSLMPIWTPPLYLWGLPDKDDGEALSAILNRTGRRVVDLHTGKDWVFPKRGAREFFSGHTLFTAQPARDLDGFHYMGMWMIERPPAKTLLRQG